MKVVLAVILALGSVSALGSGPYLPSGWRPQGPSFDLPGEVEKPVAAVKEAINIETEASGSENLREYGPPKALEVSENVINQGLPDEATEQSFYVAEEKAAVVEAVAEEKEEEEVSVRSGTEVTEEETTTESQAEAQEEVTEAQAIVEATTATAVEEVATEAIAEAVEETTSASVEEKLEQVVIEEEKTLEQVRAISETLFNLEQEIKSEQVNTEAAVELRFNQEGSGSVSAPKGFLEYGPPGFKEYGPPKAEPLGTAPLQNSFENNEARRRRFSPKFRFNSPRNVTKTISLTDN